MKKQIEKLIEKDIFFNLIYINLILFQPMYLFICFRGWAGVLRSVFIYPCLWETIKFCETIESKLANREPRSHVPPLFSFVLSLVSCLKLVSVLPPVPRGYEVREP